MDAMQLARGETARTAVPRPPSARLADTQWWYAPAVLGLSVFLIAVLYVHPPIEGYLSQAMLRRDALPNDAPPPAFSAPHSPADLNRWLHSETTLAHIAQQAGLARDDAGSPAAAIATRIERLRQHLEVAQTTDGEVQQWSVRYLGRDRLEARRIAEVAAEALASYLDRLHDNRPTEAELAALRHQIHTARNEEDRLLHEIEGLRHEQLTLTILRARQREAAANNGTVGVDSAVTPLQTGVDRSPLEEDLARLRIERSMLAANRQPTHPQIVALDAQIAQLEKQLQQARGPLLETPGRSAASEAAYPQDNSPLRAYFASNGSPNGKEPLDPAINLAARIEDAAAALRTLANERNEAERRLDAALRVAAQPWRKQWMVAETIPARRIGGTPRPPDVIWAGWMAGLAAVAMAINVNWVRGGAIGSSQQARNVLGLPLLGEVTLPHALPASPRRSTGVKRAVLSAGEWFLMLALVTFLLAVLSSRALGTELFHDPLGALVEAVDNIRGAVS